MGRADCIRVPFPAARIRIAVFCLAIVPHVIGEGDFLSLLMKACHKALTTSKARFPFQTNGNMRLARQNPTGEAHMAGPVRHELPGAHHHLP